MDSFSCVCKYNGMEILSAKSSVRCATHFVTGAKETFCHKIKSHMNLLTLQQNFALQKSIKN